jgi:hypothetical protein
MSPLATAIYKQLRKRLRTQDPSVTYAELAQGLDYRHSTHPRSPKLHAALTEVTEACKQHGLPCLPAIVCRADNHRPSTGYYKVAHPRAQTAEAQVAAWEREHARVLKDADKFPATLP